MGGGVLCVNSDMRVRYILSQIMQVVGVQTSLTTKPVQLSLCRMCYLFGVVFVFPVFFILWCGSFLWFFLVFVMFAVLVLVLIRLSLLKHSNT